MRNVLFFLMVLLIFCSLVWGKVIERVIARVNDDVITLSELNSELAGLRLELQRVWSGKQLEEEFQKRKASVLDNLIQAKILYQRAKEMGFCTNVEPEVSAYIQNVMKEHKFQSMEEFGKVLNGQGTSLEAFRENIAKSICVNRLVGQFVHSKITITTEEIEKYYKEHIAEFTKPEEIDLSEIAFRTEGKNEQEVENQARDVLQKARNGADFSELAKQYSQGPTASTGGSLGTFKQGTMDPEIEKVAFSLKEGGVSDLIRTKYGFQILKVNKKTTASATPLSEVKPKIQEVIYARKFQPELERFVKKIKEESYIYIYPESSESTEEKK